MGGAFRGGHSHIGKDQGAGTQSAQGGKTPRNRQLAHNDRMI